VPIGAVAEFEGRLRLDPPLNNQRKGVRLASEFEIRHWSAAGLDELIEAPVERFQPLEFA